MKSSATDALAERESVCVEGTVVFRRAEKIAIAYFVYSAVMISAHPNSLLSCLAAWMVPAAIWAAILLQSRFSRGWSRVTRDWAALGLVLLAYRQVDWSAPKPALVHWQHVWLGWDRTLLGPFGLRAALEHFGGWIPSALEAVYLSLYGIPALCLGALYFYKKRDQIDVFLTTLFLGTFCAYALLPHFPVAGPRIAFPDQDLPNYASVWRWVTGWLLDHCDISRSVFPSGHVAVAFSSAFGLLRTIPERRWLCAAMLTAAAVVFTATIYCRYHYTADGLASIGITTLAWRSTQSMNRNA
jgi:membrane-associated phospholipid phosphatase